MRETQRCCSPTGLVHLYFFTSCSDFRSCGVSSSCLGTTNTAEMRQPAPQSPTDVGESPHLKARVDASRRASSQEAGLRRAQWTPRVTETAAPAVGSISDVILPLSLSSPETLVLLRPAKTKGETSTQQRTLGRMWSQDFVQVWKGGRGMGTGGKTLSKSPGVPAAPIST